MSQMVDDQMNPVYIKMCRPKRVPLATNFQYWRNFFTILTFLGHFRKICLLFPSKFWRFF